MKETQKLHGIKLAKLYGGHLSCAKCGQLLGYLSPAEDIMIYLNIRCRCGNSGYLLRGMIPEPENPDISADQQESVISCPVCRRTLFSASQQTGSFGFRIQCACGHRFDRAYLRQREVYPVRELPTSCLHKKENREKE